MWRRRGGRVFAHVCGGERGERISSSSYPSPPPHFCLALFWPIFFFKTCCFCGWSAQSFSQIKQGGKKAHGDGEAALCRLNGAIVRHGGGEGDGSWGTEGVWEGGGVQLHKGYPGVWRGKSRGWRQDGFIHRAALHPAHFLCRIWTIVVNKIEFENRHWTKKPPKQLACQRGFRSLVRRQTSLLR